MKTYSIDTMGGPAGMGIPSLDVALIIARDMFLYCDWDDDFVRNDIEIRFEPSDESDEPVWCVFINGRHDVQVNEEPDRCECCGQIPMRRYV